MPGQGSLWRLEYLMTVDIKPMKEMALDWILSSDEKTKVMSICCDLWALVGAFHSVQTSGKHVL
jgi:hypothetical protein